MTRGRRFFIFFSSAGVMTLFLLFTLSVREDQPLKKYMEWTPGNQVISMILDRKDAQGKLYPRLVDFVANVECEMNHYGITQLEVMHGLRDGDVEFSHDLTFPRQKPKQYVVEIEIDDIEYLVVAKVFKNYSEVVEIFKEEDKAPCE